MNKDEEEVFPVIHPDDMPALFTVKHLRMLEETHTAITELRQLVGDALPQVEKMVSSGPMGLMLGSLFKRP